MVITGFADSFVLNNQISGFNNNTKSRMVIQWASSVKEVEENNKDIQQADKLNVSSLQAVNETGKITIDIPKNVEYFRLLVWSKETKAPDLLTNWVDVIPNKTYTINNDYLVPLVLMSGMGC